MATLTKITPCLWFDNQAEDAANFYISLFPNSKITTVARYTAAGPGPEGAVMIVAFELDGQPFVGLNGGPMFTFNEAVSFQIDCADQAEVDRYWAALSDGGQEGDCGWLKDRYGLSWQVVPNRLFELLNTGDADSVLRVTQAIYQMKKLDVATLEKAAAG